MSLQFYFGGSGIGKSRKLHEDIIAEAMQNPRTNYLVIVPDQFTMQTQMDFVNEHPSHGIMNIDVLSFGRLSHRILEEVGEDNMPLLDDTGKSLILRRIARQLEQDLPALGSKLKKIGYIHEVKSVISEFMQYGISPDGVHELVEYAKGRGALKSKLTDLETLYRAFLAYIDKQFLTKEETLGLLKRSLHKSRIIKDSVIAFDGFTGFTPIQYQVIRELLVLASQVKMTVILHGDENPYEMDGEQKLFHLSKKTVWDVKKLADQVSVGELPPVLILPKNMLHNWAKESNAQVIFNEKTRFAANPALSHLEAHILRYPLVPYVGETEAIHLSRANTIHDEIREACIRIKQLVREEHYQYRDIAVVSGDLNGYANLIQEIFSAYEIPIYLDYTRAILQNPFTRYVRSALQVAEQNFSMDAMLRYLRSGMSCLQEEEVDRLENYLRKCGIKGKRAWTHPFANKGKQSDNMEPVIAEMNGYRERIIEELEPLLKRGHTASEYIKSLYVFLVQNHCQEKLEEKAEWFEKQGDPVRGKEYSQIYRLTIDLLDQMEMLLGNEEMDYTEFLQILEAGFGELQVGTIPGEVDRVLVGDMERTRLKQVKVLFFLGINDGNIPKGTSKGGLISDIDREFLQKSTYELAPTPRQQMYLQRLYLYMNMTKPSHALYMSYAAMNEAGVTLQPSYLMNTICQMFPSLKVEMVEHPMAPQQLESESDIRNLFALSLRQYSGRRDLDKTEQILHTIYLGEDDKERLSTLADLAFPKYHSKPLAREIAGMLYGQILSASVSRLETFATCAYQHFLRYGLALKEREEFSFEAVDLGNIYHEVLEKFAHALEESGYTWMNFPAKFADEKIDFFLGNAAMEYGDRVLYSTARMKNSLAYMSRILKRSVDTMKEHLSKGSFLPREFEYSFSKLESLESLELKLTKEEKLKLRGRVDRVDVCEEADKLYVKIMDYKSGDKSFDLAAVYYGLQLQMVVYMNEVCAKQKRNHPDKEVIPAAMLYYHLDDPMVEEGTQLTEDEITEEVRKKLAGKGVVNADEHVVQLLHHELEGKSDVIPVKLKKDGGYDSSSKVLSDESMKMVSNYVNHKIRKMGQDIITGHIEVSPFEKGNGAPCSYCSFQQVCDFDERAGYSWRKSEAGKEEDILERMKEELGLKKESETIEESTETG